MRTILTPRGGLALLAVLGVAAGTAYGILRLQDASSHHEDARVLLATVRAESVELSQLEWQAVAERGVSDHVAGRQREARASARAALDQTMRAVGSGGGVAAVERELDVYLTAIDTEFSLLEGGRLDEARRVDERTVDPAFERLRASIEHAQAVEHGRARRAQTIAGSGTVVLLLLGLAVSGLLFWRLSATKQEARKAFFDPLTGLANRMLLTDRLTHALARADRAGEHVGVLFLDMDDFKRINDTLGHAAGDTLLRAAAERLSTAARTSDTVGRLGGDEFALVLEGNVDADSLEETASRFTEALARPFEIAGHSVTMTVSGGCALSDPGATSSDELLRNADLAMYAGKRQGKRCVVMYEPSMYEALSDRLALETDLRGALARNEISVVYQPIVEIETGQLRAFEALARWTHPVRGNIAPALFIPLAEETAMVREIGRFVLREATAQLRRWQLERALTPPLRLAVNVSPTQLQNNAIVDDVREALAESGTDASTLTLEITESVLVERGDRFRKTLEELHALGVTLAIDDFGTGYSSLASLSTFPIRSLKIDKSFIANLANDDSGRDLVRSIVELGRALGLDAVAEGIETPEQAELLRELDCDYGQGYHYSRPLTSATADELVQEHSTAAPAARRMRDEPDPGVEPTPRPLPN